MTADEEFRSAVRDLIECVRPNDNAAGPWLAKSSGGVEWHLLGPRYAERAARTVVGVIGIDSFPGEEPSRAERVAKAIVVLINAALKDAQWR